jgi:proteic killer suppression protein
MIISFANVGTDDVFNGRDTRLARQACPQTLWSIARRKLDMLDSTFVLGDLRSPPGNHLEELKGNRKGQHSIRINEKYRICFRWVTGGADEVEIVDYH